MAPSTQPSTTATASTQGQEAGVSAAHNFTTDTHLAFGVNTRTDTMMESWQPALPRVLRLRAITQVFEFRRVGLARAGD